MTRAEEGNASKPMDYKKEFCKLFGKLAHKYSSWEVWNDFLYMVAAAFANRVPHAKWKEREDCYLKIVSKYLREEIDVFPKLMTMVCEAIMQNPEQDFLGELYHQMNLQQNQKGQFFTPYHVSELTARINMPPEQAKQIIEEKGYMSVMDPACGAGSLLIASANVLRRGGVDYTDRVLYVAQDIDRTAALMCYIQLTILGCNAIIIIGDSLLKPGFHKDNDVWETLSYTCNAWKFQKFFKSQEDSEEVKAGKDVSEVSDRVDEALEETEKESMDVEPRCESKEEQAPLGFAEKPVCMLVPDENTGQLRFAI